MKLTESQLRRIIREELEKTTKLSYTGRSPQGYSQATYLGKIAGKHIAVDAMKNEFVLDPYEVEHLPRGHKLSVKATPGRYAEIAPKETRSEFYLTDEFNDDDSGLWMMDDKTPYAIDYSEDVLDDPRTMRMGRRMQEGRFSGKDSWSKVPKVGSIYKVGYGRHVWESRFEGWTIENNEPYMNWTDMKNGDPWSAYIYDGVVSVGSSANPLLIHGEVM